MDARSLISSVTSTCKELVVVDLHNVAIGADGVPVGTFFVQNSPGLKSLDLSFTGSVLTSEHDAIELLKVPKLGFAGNKLKNVEPFCTGLARNDCQCTSLDLSNNLLDDQQQLLLLTTLRFNVSLSRLELSKNGAISRKNASSMLSILLQNVTLTDLGMPQLTDDHKLKDQFNDLTLKDQVSLMLRQNISFAEGLQSPNFVACSLNSRSLSYIPRLTFSWLHLVSLNLSENQLTAISFDIVELKHLDTLNIAKNQITADALPVHLCLLPNLKKLSVRENPFVASIPSGVPWRDDTQALLLYFKSVAQSEEPVLQPGRVMVIGDRGVGKSTLVSTLAAPDGGEPKPKTKIVDRLKKLVQTHSVSAGKIVEITGPLSFSKNVSLSFWELAGARNFLPVHGFFLQRAECLFVVVFSLLTPNSAMRLDYWMDSITSKCPQANVVVVATHVDRCQNADEVIRSVQQKYSRFKKTLTLHGVFAVNALAKASLESVKNLLAALGEGMFRNAFMAPSPPSHGLLCSLLSAEELPVIAMSRFHEICRSCMLVSPAQQEAALHSRRQAGAVLWYDLPVLRELVVVNVNWLVQSLTSLVTFNATDVGSDGKLAEAEFGRIWPTYEFAERSRPLMLTLLEQFGLTHRFDTCYVMPSILASDNPALDEIARCQALASSQSER
jgi:GTPase SAR1 family protein